MGTPVYIDSTATGVNDGTSWTDAYVLEQSALTAYAAGEEGWEAHDHTETPGATIDKTASAANTTIQKMPIYRVNSGTNVYSPTTGADTPQIDISAGAYDIDLNCSLSYFGQYFKLGGNFLINNTEESNSLTDCHIEFTGSGKMLQIGTFNSNAIFSMKGGAISFTTNGAIYSLSGPRHFNGVVFTGDVRGAGFIYGNSARTLVLDFVSCDFSGLTDATQVIFWDVSTALRASAFIRVINCDIPTGMDWTDGGFGSDNQVLEVWSTDSGGNLYIARRETLRGTVSEDTSVYRDAGYQDLDGPTNLSMKMETRAATTEPHTPLESIALGEYYLSTGSTTFEIECLENFTTPLTKRQAWPELHYLGGASETLWTLDDSSREKVASSYTNLAAGTGLANWTGEPGGSRSVKLTVTVTVNQAGMYMLKLFLGAYESGKVLHYCPDPVIT